MNKSFVAHNKEYPSVYKIRFEKPSELLALFEHVILKDAEVSRVGEELVKYVTTIIEPLDWTAIWRTTFESFNFDFTCDLLVEVIDVSRNALEATIVLKEVLSPQLTDISEEEKNALQKMTSEETVKTVPLIELYVVSEEDEAGQFLQTALVVEHIRFFWKCIWRPWDDCPGAASSQRSFVGQFFHSRFNLYGDIQNGVIDSSTANKINHLLEEAWKVRKRMDTIYDGIGIGDDTCFDKDVIDENVMYEYVKLRHKLEDMERIMKLFEDPFSRPIALSMVGNFVPEVTNALVYNSSRRIHIVSPCFTLASLQTVLPVLEDPDFKESKIFFHQSVAAALRASTNGDEIMILPGVYVCDVAMPWIDKNVTIKGMGDSSGDVLIQSDEETTNVFLHCNAQSVIISNLTLRTTAMKCIVMVHIGVTKLLNCVLDGGSNAQNMVITLSTASVELKQCNITSKAKSGMITAGGDEEIECVIQA